MKKGYATIGAMLLLAATTVLQAQPQVTSPPANGDNLFRDQEFSLDAFGGGTVYEHEIDPFNGSRFHHDTRLGLGIGANWFFLRYLGIDGELYTENPNHIFVNDASANVLVRLPLENTGFAPYALGGGGHEFEPISATFSQFGGGVEYRFTPNVGLFADVRYVFTDNNGDHGMGRIGVRFAF